MPVGIHSDVDAHAIAVYDAVDRPTRRRRANPPREPDSAFVDLTNDPLLGDYDYMSDDTLTRNFSRLFPSTNDKKGSALPSSIESASEKFQEDWIEFDYCTKSGAKKKVRLAKGKSVELKSGEFLRIQSVMTHVSFIDENTKFSIFVRGDLFARTRNLNGALHFKSNEVAMVESDTEVSGADIKCPRKLIVTNAPFPIFRDWEGGDDSWLVCRWFWNVSQMNHSGVIRKVTEYEADRNYRWPDSRLRYEWRERLLSQAKRKNKHQQSYSGSQPLEKKRIEDLVNPADNVSAVEVAWLSQRQAAGGSAAIKRVIETSIDKCSTTASSSLTVNSGAYPRTPGMYAGEPDHFLKTSKYRSSHAKSWASTAPITLDIFSYRNLGISVKPPRTRLFGEDGLSIKKKAEIIPCTISSLDRIEASGNPKERLCLMSSQTSELSLVSMPEGQKPKSISPTLFKRKTHPNISGPDVLAWMNFRPGESLLLNGNKKYTYGDAFCGAGGATCGARMAGLDIIFGFDKDTAAIQTWKANFPEGTAYHTTVDAFNLLEDDSIVDVMHISPPCQPFSPAHTIEGRDDDANRAAMFCIDSVLKKCRPRFATLEQTTGILYHVQFFLRILNMFTEQGYSVAYRVLRGVEYGLPQDRKRLFVIAASPGENLPPWPKATHSCNPSPPPGLKRFTSLNETLDAIPVDATEHEPKPFPTPRAVPYNPNLYLTRTIMAGGGDYDVHPSGKRPFTPREISSIQGFPLSYQFKGSFVEKKRQIGNAVPPIMAAAIFVEIREAMEEADRRRECGEGGKWDEHDEIVEVSDEQDDEDDVEVVLATQNWVK